MSNNIITLFNSKNYPFNNSLITVSLPVIENDVNYHVITEIISQKGGDAGDVIISGRAVNGFKIAYTGSAEEVTIRYGILKGFWNENC